MGGLARSLARLAPRQWRIHERAKVSIPIHQKKRTSMLAVHETPRWQEVVAWQVCSTHGRINIRK